MQLELEHWHSLFMFGLVVPDEIKDRIKAAAYERFLNEKASIMEFAYCGEIPSSWFTKDEEEFRKLLRERYLRTTNEQDI